MYHVMLLALLYGAFGLEQQPFLNVLTFIVWASAVVMPFGLSDRSQQSHPHTPPGATLGLCGLGCAADPGRAGVR